MEATVTPSPAIFTVLHFKLITLKKWGTKFSSQDKKVPYLTNCTDSVGPTTANRAIIDVYDIFGMASQTIQGADRLASSLKALVLIPDFFKGSPLAAENFPPDTEEKKETIQKFFVEKANFTENKEVLLNVVKEAKENFPSVGSWGAYGLCWGGKLVAMTSAEGTSFKASGQVHPAYVYPSSIAPALNNFFHIGIK